ncbi:protease [Polar bear adenovirus 1]|uniref:Protease n=1 Tax=Polar bear adenovirus 1 TaxID=2250215 RepID=A0A2Z4QJC5_9ADEN|nr:protease [Polar bear adenovirus 1]AWY10563.1 protease [Polar bear adenovirus 1]AXI68660.1 protease [Polar bear adenovirus 1]
MGSTEEELRYIIRDLGIDSIFLGTFDRTFPGFISKHKTCCAIVNTGTRREGGVHWLAMGWHPRSRTFYMFDPFGFSDDKLKQIYDFEYHTLMKRSAILSTPDRCLTLVTSTQSVQGPDSAACGLFCCLFLYGFKKWPMSAMDNPVINILHGVSNNKLYDPKCQHILENNQKELYAFLSRTSPYFNSKRAMIEANTSFEKGRL